jgi:ankyrin repeat protein
LAWLIYINHFELVKSYCLIIYIQGSNQYSNKETVQALINAGADINTPNNDGQTPLDNGSYT